MIKELFCQQNVFGSHDLAILRVIREVQDFPRALRLCATTPSSACCCREYTFLYFAIFYMFFSLLLERDNFFFSLHTLLYSAGSLSLGMSLKDLLIVPLWARLDSATALLFFLWFDNYNQVLLKDEQACLGKAVPFCPILTLWEEHTLEICLWLSFVLFHRSRSDIDLLLILFIHFSWAAFPSPCFSLCQSEKSQV